MLLIANLGLFVYRAAQPQSPKHHQILINDVKCDTTDARTFLCENGIGIRFDHKILDDDGHPVESHPIIPTSAVLNT